VLDLVRGISTGRGATVVLSTHLLDEVEEVCTRVIILNRGRVVADGTVGEIVRRAADPGQAHLQVPADRAQQALDVLNGARGLAVASAEGRPGELELTLGAGEKPEAAMAEALRLLLDADVPVLGLWLEGRRLSDAFLAMTEAA
jgi:ABC-2 type transport system ATP-binding protein